MACLKFGPATELLGCWISDGGAWQRCPHSIKRHCVWIAIVTIDFLVRNVLAWRFTDKALNGVEYISEGSLAF